MHKQLFNILLIIVPFAGLVNANIGFLYCKTAPIEWGVRIHITVSEAFANTKAKTPGNCAENDLKTCIALCPQKVSLTAVCSITMTVNNVKVVRPETSIGMGQS